jgi:hypothetical protein
MPPTDSPTNFLKPSPVDGPAPHTSGQSTNLALMQIGPAVADHDSQAMNEPATKQDLYNMGVQIDSNFGKVDSRFANVENQITNLRTDMNAGFDRVDGQFTNLRTDMDAKFTKVDSQISNLRTDTNAGFERVDSQISNLRTDMDAKFDKAQVALNKTLFKFGSLYFTMMFAVLSIERWWR